VNLAAVIAAVTLGVLLPKVLPALLAPRELDRRSRLARTLRSLPAGILGSLTAVTAFGAPPQPGQRWPILVAVGATGLLLIGWRALRARLLTNGSQAEEVAGASPET